MHRLRSILSVRRHDAKTEALWKEVPVCRVELSFKYENPSHSEEPQPRTWRLDD